MHLHIAISTLCHFEVFIFIYQIYLNQTESPIYTEQNFIVPHASCFKFNNFKDENFTTLIDVRLIHSKDHLELKEVPLEYGYNTIKKIELPLFRGNQKYGIINILSVDKIN